jgi:hypothetical protein
MTRVTEEVAKESSDIACLGARRLLVRLERLFTLAQVLVVGLVAVYTAVHGCSVGCRGDGPPRGLGGAGIGDHRQ